MDFPPVRLGERELDVKIIPTRNRNAYARVRDGSIIITLPSRMGADSASRVAQSLYARISRAIIKRPERYLYDKGEEIKFHDGETVSVLGRSFDFHVSSSGKNARASLKGSSINIRIPESHTREDQERTISYLGRRIISKAIINDLNYRVKEANDRHFNSPISQVRLLNASTRWGSCTTKRGEEGARIMLNFKLLFMPTECLDYVIVHELAHTKVQGHSERFWNIVRNIIPDYKNRIKLLRQNAYRIRSDNGIINNEGKAQK